MWRCELLLAMNIILIVSISLFFTFLHTIIFHNERYLLENFDSLTRNELNSLARKGKEAYVIDMGTLCNDSLMVYQTEIRMSGCRE